MQAIRTNILFFIFDKSKFGVSSARLKLQISNFLQLSMTIKTLLQNMFESKQKNGTQDTKNLYLQY